MEIQFTEILTYLSPVLTGAIGWFAGRKKKNNDFLKDLQESVCMLTDRNKELLKELIEVRKENATLLNNQHSLSIEIEKLRVENTAMRNEIEHLNERLSNVKTITKKG